MQSVLGAEACRVLSGAFVVKEVHLLSEKWSGNRLLLLAATLCFQSSCLCSICVTVLPNSNSPVLAALVLFVS